MAGRVGTTSSSRTTAALVAIGVLAAVAACRASRPVVQPRQEPIDEPVALVAEVTEPEAPRLAAARRLVVLADREDVRERIRDFLDGPINGGQPGALICRAIADQPEVDSRLLPILRDRLSRAEESEQPALWRALGAFSTREAAAVLVQELEASQTAARRVEVLRALERQTGRTDLGSDPDAWRAWLAAVMRLSGPKWQIELAQAQKARAMRLEADRARVGLALADIAGQLHLATPAEGRDALLASLMTSETPELRDLGLTLVQRELSADNRLGPAVAGASIALLAHSSASVRARAATLLRQIAPQEARLAVFEALERETDPQAAGALLTASQRWLEPHLSGPALRWSSAEAAARVPAFELLSALVRMGYLHQAPQEEAVREAARNLAPEDFTPSAVRVLGLLGNEQDQSRIATLLSSADPAVRSAAAQHLAWDPEYRARILAAARKYPDLFGHAVMAQLVQQPDAAGFREVLTIPAPSPEERIAGLTQLARGTPAADLSQVIDIVHDPALRHALQEELTSPDRLLSEGSDPAARLAIGRGAWRFAGELLDADQPDRALSLLESASLEGIVDASTQTAMRCECLVAFGRLDLAQQLDAGVEPWLRGLERAVAKPHAKDAADLVRTRFDSVMTDEQRARLKAAEESIASRVQAQGTRTLTGT